MEKTMRRFELRIPDKAYWFVLVTWCAVVVGIVLVYGSRYSSRHAPEFPSDYQTYRVLREESDRLRQQNAELAGELQRLLSDDKPL
jgi:hypothetical protein